MSKNYFYEIIFSRVALIIFVVLMFIIMGIAKQSPATMVGVKANNTNDDSVSEINNKIMLPDSALIDTEIADTPELKERGLSGRNSLAGNSSMLFVFDSEGYYDFWMPDMSFALDMIWMDKDYTIVDITKNAVPMPNKAPEELPKYRSLAPAQYVLEVNAGFSGIHNLKVGDILKLYVRD